MTDNFERDINVPSKRPPYEIALMHDHILRLEEELKAKEQECVELKKAEEYDSRYNDMQAEIDCGEKIIIQLKQTLTEIKELCQKHIKAEKIVMANDILQKISECEAVNDYVI